AGGALPLPAGPVQGAAEDPGEVPRDGPVGVLQRRGLLGGAAGPGREGQAAAAVLPEPADAGPGLGVVLADDGVQPAQQPAAGGALPLPAGPVQGAAEDPGEVPRDGPVGVLQRRGLLGGAAGPGREGQAAAAVLPEPADAGPGLGVVLADDGVQPAQQPAAGG